MRWNATRRPPASTTAALILMLICCALAMAPWTIRLASSNVMLIDALLVGGRNALTRRDHTEALRLDPERRVELAAEIFERDRRGQFDDLLFAVMLFEAREQRVVHRLAGDRHVFGIVQRDPFAVAEQ